MLGIASELLEVRAGTFLVDDPAFAALLFYLAIAGISVALSVVAQGMWAQLAWRRALGHKVSWSVMRRALAQNGQHLAFWSGVQVLPSMYRALAYATTSQWQTRVKDGVKYFTSTYSYFVGIIFIALSLITYVELKIALTTSAMVIEKLTLKNALMRSWQLSKGHLIALFCIGLVSVLPGVIVEAVFDRRFPDNKSVLLAYGRLLLSAVSAPVSAWLTAQVYLRSTALSWQGRLFVNGDNSTTDSPG